MVVLCSTDVRRRRSLAPLEGVQIHGAGLGAGGGGRLGGGEGGENLPDALGTNRSFIWGELSSCDSIGSFHSDTFEQRWV